MNYLEYKGYKGSVDYDAENRCLVGKVLGMSKDSITYEGNTIDELEADFRNGIDDYLESCKEAGIVPRKPYGGNLNVRMPSHIHEQLALIAEKENVKINTVINKAIDFYLHH